MTIGSTGPPRQDTARSGRLWVALAALLGALAGLRYLAIFLRYDAYGIAKYFMVDDAFYYFQVARNIALGHGSTFDGVHVTNGYHPMWLLTATAAYALAGPAGSAPLFVLYGLQIVLVLASGWLLYLALRPLHRVSAAFAVALLVASNQTRNVLFNGMESTLAFFLISALFYLAMRRGKRFYVPAPASYAWLVFGLILALCFTRLEAGLFVPLWMLGAIIVWRQERSPYLGRIAWMAAGLLAAAAVYVTVNYRLVGKPFPISGMIKSGLRDWSQIANVLVLQLEAYVGLIGPPAGKLSQLDPILGVLLAASLGHFLFQLRRRNPARLVAVAPFVAFAAAYVVVAATLLSGGFGWYKWAALLAGALSTFALFEWMLESSRIPRRLVLSGLVAVTALFAAVSWVPILKQRTLADWGPLQGLVMDYTIRFIREEIPREDRIGAYSNGIFTYFSGRDIENLEGLVNGRAFYEARRRPDTYAAYLRDNKIRWIVVHTTYDWEIGRILDQFRKVSSIERVVSLDDFYHLKLRELHPTLGDPNVYILKLRGQPAPTQASSRSEDHT